MAKKNQRVLLPALGSPSEATVRTEGDHETNTTVQLTRATTVTSAPHSDHVTSDTNNNNDNNHRVLTRRRQLNPRRAHVTATATATTGDATHNTSPVPVQRRRCAERPSTSQALLSARARQQRMSAMNTPRATGLEEGRRETVATTTTTATTTRRGASWPPRLQQLTRSPPASGNGSDVTSHSDAFPRSSTCSSSLSSSSSRETSETSVALPPMNAAAFWMLAPESPQTTTSLCTPSEGRPSESPSDKTPTVTSNDDDHDDNRNISQINGGSADKASADSHERRRLDSTTAAVMEAAHLLYPGEAEPAAPPHPTNADTPSPNAAAGKGNAPAGNVEAPVPKMLLLQRLLAQTERKYDFWRPTGGRAVAEAMAVDVGAEGESLTLAVGGGTGQLRRASSALSLDGSSSTVTVATTATTTGNAHAHAAGAHGAHDANNDDSDATGDLTFHPMHGELGRHSIAAYHWPVLPRSVKDGDGHAAAHDGARFSWARWPSRAVPLVRWEPTVASTRQADSLSFFDVSATAMVSAAAEEAEGGRPLSLLAQASIALNTEDEHVLPHPQAAQTPVQTGKRATSLWRAILPDVVKSLFRYNPPARASHAFLSAAAGEDSNTTDAPSAPSTRLLLGRIAAAPEPRDASAPPLLAPKGSVETVWLEPWCDDASAMQPHSTSHGAPTPMSLRSAALPAPLMRLRQPSSLFWGDGETDAGLLGALLSYLCNAVDAAGEDEESATATHQAGCSSTPGVSWQRTGDVLHLTLSVRSCGLADRKSTEPQETTRVLQELTLTPKMSSPFLLAQQLHQALIAFAGDSRIADALHDATLTVQRYSVYEECSAMPRVLSSEQTDALDTVGASVPSLLSPPQRRILSGTLRMTDVACPHLRAVTLESNATVAEEEWDLRAQDRTLQSVEAALDEVSAAAPPTATSEHVVLVLERRVALPGTPSAAARRVLAHFPRPPCPEAHPIPCLSADYLRAAAGPPASFLSTPHGERKDDAQTHEFVRQGLPPSAPSPAKEGTSLLERSTEGRPESSTVRHRELVAALGVFSFPPPSPAMH